jgi:hypothetical protein
LERNRWATVVRTYPAPVLAVVAPALLATELGIWAVALRDGWGRMKWLATLDLLRALPALVRQRRRIQATATISPSEFTRQLVATLDSPYFGAVGRHPWLRTALSGYWSIARVLIARWSRRSTS